MTRKRKVRASRDRTPTWTRASVMYGYVRSLQLEGRYPEDCGVWPISAMRIAFGWGFVPHDFWPPPTDGSWPPVEPPNADKIARRNRASFYQRIRSSADVKRAVANGHAAMVALPVTRQWKTTRDGHVSVPSAPSESIGDHAVLIVGYQDDTFTFANSWGERWGDRGYGYLPASYVSRFLVEGYAVELRSVLRPPRDQVRDVLGVRILAGPLGDPVHIVEVWDRPNGEREAWMFAVERDGCFDIEELFVRPQYRRKGAGAWLVEQALRHHATVRGKLRAWVSHCDGAREGMAGVRKIMQMLGLTLRASTSTWARFVGEESERRDAPMFGVRSCRPDPPKPIEALTRFVPPA